jgi:hypothetical protein
MIGTRRLDNIQALIEQILQTQVPGDLIETGIWRGGSTIFMRGVLKAYGVTDRTVWVADSFAGFPRTNSRDCPLRRSPHQASTLCDQIGCTRHYQRRCKTGSTRSWKARRTNRCENGSIATACSMIKSSS